MKNTNSPTNIEYEFQDNSLLISKLGQDGSITYCNTGFLNATGYKEDELLGQKYELLQHPDMPQVIYKILWDTLNSNREFNGYFKNITKDGGFYWCFANVTPSFNSANEIIGFHLVQRKPDVEKLNYIQNLYLELREIELQDQSAEAITESQYKLNSVLNGREMGYDEFVFSI